MCGSCKVQEKDLVQSQQLPMTRRYLTLSMNRVLLLGWDQGNATAGGSRRHFGPGVVRRPMSSGPRRMGSALGVNVCTIYIDCSIFAH